MQNSSSTNAAAAGSSSRNAVVLEHPSGCQVLLIGTHHVAATAGNQTAVAVEEHSPSRVVLELDEARFQQLDFRLRHLLHADTSTLMELSAADGSSWLRALLPDALLWGAHMKQWALLRNEGVPLLLGSLYGADFLQAALAASALPQQASLVLADQPQHLTLARFAALTDTLGALRHLLGGLFGTAHAEAHHPYSAHHQQYQQQQLQILLPTALSNPSTSSSTTIGPLDTLQQLGSIFTAAAQLAAGRMLHLALSWWSMALTSQARWYADNLHPVFLLVGDSDLQRKLTARGCEGVAEAAAAAGRLLEVAAAAAAAPGSSSSSSSSTGREVLPAEEDLLAVRKFVASLESVMRSDTGAAAATAASDSSSSSSSSRQSVVHWLEAYPNSNSSSTAAGCGSQEEAGLGELLSLRPWWVTLSESFSSKLAQLGGSSSSSSSSSSNAGVGLASALQQHQHANVTAAAAYDRAVMAERNAVLVSALWQHAAAAAEEAEEAQLLSQQQQQQQQPGRASVVAVVGYNHLPGIVQLWRQLQQQHDAAAQQLAHSTTTTTTTTTSSSSAVDAGVYPLATAADGGPDGAFLPWQVTLTDAVAGVLELAAAGGAGLCYLAGINRWAPSAAAAAAAGSSSGSNARLAAKAAGSGPGMRRLGLLLLPAAVALLPLQRDAKRVQEAGGLLSKVAVVNDVILRWEAGQLQQGGVADSSSSSSSSIMQMALRAGAQL